jgi:hypothetical protein
MIDATAGEPVRRRQYTSAQRRAGEARPFHAIGSCIPVI